MKRPGKRLRAAATDRRTLIGLASLLCAAVAVGAVLTWSARQNAAAPLTIADVSGRPTACLASSAGQDETTASHLWSAMHHAASGKRINVQQVQIPLPHKASAEPYLAGLINQHCDLVVTVGKPFGQAISALRNQRTIRFIAVDSGLTREVTSTITFTGATAAPQAIQAAMDVLAGPHSKK